MISIASIKPNLLIILTVSFGLMRGKIRHAYRIFCGLLTDIFFNSIIGFQCADLSLGWVFQRLFIPIHDDDIKTPLFLISISDLIYGIVQYGFMFLMRGRIHFFLCYLGVDLAGGAYTH